MNKYAKIINETEVEFAPKNKGSIINYNLNIEAMISDGYKPFVPAETENDKAYEFSYEETETEIIEIAKEIPPIPEEKILEQAKEAKKSQVIQKAYDWQENGYVSYKGGKFEFNQSNRNNLRDTQEALEKTGQASTFWNDKDDKLIELTVEDIQYIRLNLILNEIKSIWVEYYPKYLQEIESASTVEELEAIEIDYDKNESEELKVKEAD